jgi:uncharacterized protein YbbC (DUF1343 family)
MFMGWERTLKGSRIGLLAHPASVDARFVHIADLLRERGLAHVIAFGPEHGYGGEAQDMIGVGDAVDAFGVPVRSLYGDDESALVPTDADLSRVDVLLVDLQDVGSRYYTFVWTAVLAARACAKNKVRMVVLDRPNPLGNEITEGRVQRDPKCLSFVGLVPIPIRHAMTLGEIVKWRKAIEKLDLDLTVIARDDVPFVMPSPNMPTIDTALVYPGGCLLEGTNLSEGRGTTRPFEIFGAPFIAGRRLARDLMALGLPGFVARPIVFQPTFHKHAKQNCGGVAIHPTDRREFRPVATYVAAIALCHRQAPDKFAFRTERYEFRDDVPAYDLLTGDSEARERTLAGEDPRQIGEAISKAEATDIWMQRSS